MLDARPALISSRLMFGAAVGTTILGAMAVASLCGRRFGRTTATETTATETTATETTATETTRPEESSTEQLVELDRSSAALHDDWPDSDALIVIVEDDDIFLNEDGVFLDEDDEIFAEEDDRSQ